MKIKWLGHSCFLLSSASGTRIVTDPFNHQVGYPVPDVEADIVTTSHNHFDHGYIQGIRGTFLHLDKPGKYERNGISITGIPTYHDKVKGIARGNNIVFIFEIDGLRICHCGDIGHLFNERQIDAIGKADILMIPVGGVFTIDASEAYRIIDLLKPQIAIPMHYGTPVLKFKLGGLDKFLKEAGITERSDAFIHKREIEVTPSIIAQFPKIVVMDYE